jgi:anti-sigma regulatory factor (Ser/Thr protein kinase)
MEAMTLRPPALTGLSIRVPIDEQSQIGAARRAAVALANEHALSGEAIGRLAIIVTEAATNVLIHGNGGVLLLRALSSALGAQIEVLALDKGAGIPDVARAMHNGYSTSGTAGQGLGAMQRLAQVFGIYSQRGGGTAVLARVGAPKPRDSSPSDFPIEDRMGVVCVPLRDQLESGDAWRLIALQNGVALLLVDGLGHGEGAATASAVAINMFPRFATSPPESALVDFDRAMRGTRGAALSMATMDEASSALRFAGVGNVDGRILRGESAEHLVPQNGIVGHTMPNMRGITTTWPAGARLVMHSDGLSTRWRTESYPGLARLHPALLAGVLYRDFGRERDDATVIVLDARASGRT